MTEPILRAGHIRMSISDATTKCTQTLPLMEVLQFKVSNEADFNTHPKMDIGG